jgi:hypothetical protein
LPNLSEILSQIDTENEGNLHNAKKTVAQKNNDDSVDDIELEILSNFEGAKILS